MTTTNKQNIKEAVKYASKLGKAMERVLYSLCQVKCENGLLWFNGPDWIIQVPAPSHVNFPYTEMCKDELTRLICDEIEVLELKEETDSKGNLIQSFVLNCDGIKQGFTSIKAGEEYLHNMPHNDDTDPSVQISAETVKKMVPYICKEPLKPQMCCLHIEKGYMVATDAHRLIEIPCDYTGEDPINVDREFLLNTIGCHYLGYKMINTSAGAEPKTRLMFQFTNKFNFIGWHFAADLDGVKYPDYKCVIPQDVETGILLDVNTFIPVLERATKAANQTTKQIVFSCNGKTELKAIDIDYNREFSQELNAIHNMTDDNNQLFEIGFNGEILKNCLSDYTGDVFLQMSKPSRAAQFLKNGDRVLIMPVMLSH